MIAEQAVFTSADTRFARGYQLVARSAGITEELARTLCHWAPTHSSLLCPNPDDWSLNYFQVSDQQVAITRSVHGGPEYSGRGGLQVVTLMLSLPIEQYAEYHFDPLALTRTALALGYLRFTTDIPERLPVADLPDQPLIRPAPESPAYRAFSPPVARILERIRAGKRTAAIGLPDAWSTIKDLLVRLSMPQRLALSFSTRLAPSVQRQFQLQFLHSADASTLRTLQEQGIECVPMETVS